RRLHARDPPLGKDDDDRTAFERRERRRDRGPIGARGGALERDDDPDGAPHRSPPPHLPGPLAIAAAPHVRTPRKGCRQKEAVSTGPIVCWPITFVFRATSMITTRRNGAATPFRTEVKKSASIGLTPVNGMTRPTSVASATTP